MDEFTKQELTLVLEALNFLLKNQQNALESSGIIVPVAVKIQALMKKEEVK
jgi:hypothetical protein